VRAEETDVCGVLDCVTQVDMSKKLHLLPRANPKVGAAAAAARAKLLFQPAAGRPELQGGVALAAAGMAMGPLPP